MKLYQFKQLQARINELEEERHTIWSNSLWSSGYAMNEEATVKLRLHEQHLNELYASKRRLLRHTEPTFVGIDR